MLRTGALLTAVWLGFLFGFYWAKGATLGTLSPNELGDMLAGSFSPLAFAWIVIAVLLQGRELDEQREEIRRNGDALVRQADELQRSVNMMRAAHQQREDERRLQLVREVARRIVYLMYVIADECRAYRVVRVDNGGSGQGEPIFGRSDLYLV